MPQYQQVWVSTQLYHLFDVWVPLAALLLNFMEKYVFLMEKWYSFLKQHWFATSTKFRLSSCSL